MGKWVHRLRKVDKKDKTAICSNCGPVKISHAGNGMWGCSIRRNQTKRVWIYKKRYGTDVKLPENLVCSICGGKAKVAYDHSHSTGKFRGWLCIKCNTALGLVNDDVKILKKMIVYLS